MSCSDWADLPPLGQDQRGAFAALVRVCKETPAKGEPFREFRTRLRAAKLWDKIHAAEAKTAS